MPNIYLATLKNYESANQFNAEKYNFFVIKEHNYNKFKKLIKKSVSIDLVENYDPSNKYLLSFKVDEHQSIGFKAYIESKLEEFKKESNDINKESIIHFFKFLEADGLYHFEMLSSNEKSNESSAPIKLLETLNKELFASSQNFLDAERHSNSRSRSNSVSDSKTETGSLRRINSSPKISIEIPDIKPEQSSAFSQEPIKIESPKLYSDVLAREIQSIFFKNETLLNIEKHKSVLEKGYFNGKEKFLRLSTISEQAENIELTSRELLNNPLSEVDIETLKKNISELKDYINNKETTDTLSRYRGFSPLRCFARFWGGGKVKSIEYVEQLQGQLDKLSQNISDIRATV